MRNSLSSAAVPAQDNRFDGVDLHMAKASVKSLDQWAKTMGEAIDYAISLSNRTQKEVWVALGHSDGAMLNRWIAGTQTANLGHLFSVEWLRRPLVIALAGLAGQGISIETVIRVG